MESRVKLLGHPIHPVLIVFPLGLLVTSFLFDLIRLAGGDGTWSLVAEYMIGAGVLGGLAAAVFGVIDWLAIPAGTRAKSIGLLHGLGNGVVMLLFAGSWLLRQGDPANPGVGALVLSFLGVSIGAVAGWLGGELVNRLAVGVDDGANANAPSSLSRRGPGRRAA